MSAPSGQRVSVGYATADGTATAGIDYVAGNGTVVFLPGQTNQTLSVAVNGDLLNELAETFLVNLSGATNAVIGQAQAVVTIIDDDAAPEVTVSDARVVEGNTGTTNAMLTLRLSAPSGQKVSVNYATGNGTATAGSDYLAANGIVTFAPGQTTQTVSVAVNGEIGRASCRERV